MDALARHDLLRDKHGRNERQIGFHSFYRPADSMRVWSHAERDSPETARAIAENPTFRAMHSQTEAFHAAACPQATERQKQTVSSAVMTLRACKGEKTANVWNFSRLFPCSTITLGCSSSPHRDRLDCGISGQHYFGSFRQRGRFTLYSLRLRFQHGPKSYIALAASRLEHGSEGTFEGFRAMSASYLPSFVARE